MTETDEKLFQEFMRIVRSEEGVALEVGLVVWDSPHTPSIQWKAFQTWPQEPGEQELAEARKRALRSKRFFKVCRSCKERQNAGHMFDAELCQACASSQLGVVY